MTIAEKIIIVTTGVIINTTIAAVLPVILYYMIRYPEFAKWIKDGIEDGDDKAHKQDFKDLVLLFWASVCAWSLIVISFVWLFFDRDLQMLFLSMLGAATTFFGISKLTAK